MDTKINKQKFRSLTYINYLTDKIIKVFNKPMIKEFKFSFKPIIYINNMLTKLKHQINVQYNINGV